MKKHIFIFCSFVASFFLVACGDAEGPTYEGTVVTGYNTFPFSEFYVFTGTKRAEAASLLYSFMTDESRKYWESFQYSGDFHSNVEYFEVKKKQEDKCIAHYEEKKSLLEEEDIEGIFASAPDSCVFTAQFKFALQTFPDEYDTTFVVQRPVIQNTQWEKIENSGNIDIVSISFIDETYASLEYATISGTWEQRAKYRRSGSVILLSNPDNDTNLFRIHIPTIRKFILYDATGEIKYGEFEPVYTPAG